MSKATEITRITLPADSSASRPLSVRTFGLTHRGRVRPNNEDQFLIAELTKAMRVLHASLPQPATQFSDERGHLFIVADGMGGHRAGEKASALAVETIEAFALNTLKWFFLLKAGDDQNVLKEFQAALQKADAKVCQEAARDSELTGMGTTVTMAHSIGSRLFVVHVGDSRCYVYRHHELHRLTHDHTLVADMLARGQIEPQRAAHHQFRHVITNVIGGREVGVQVECHRVELEAGDAVLLCSDGLTEMIPDKRIAAALEAEDDPKAACQRLVKEANDQGGKDNITVIVARFD